MRVDLLEPLARLVTTAEAIEGLRDLFAAEEPLDVIADRVAATAVAAIPYVRQGSVPGSRVAPRASARGDRRRTTSVAGIR